MAQGKLPKSRYQLERDNIQPKDGVEIRRSSLDLRYPVQFSSVLKTNPFPI